MRNRIGVSLPILNKNGRRKNSIRSAGEADKVNPIAYVEELVGTTGRGTDALLPILQAIQTKFRYLPEEALHHVCRITQIRPADIEGVASFYSQFRRKPIGRFTINVCHGTACHVKGSGLVHEALTRYLELSPGEDTDKEGLFTLQRVFCLGCCTLAPVMQIEGVTYGHLSTDNADRALKDFLKLDSESGVFKAADKRFPDHFDMAEVRVGMGSCCIAIGSQKVQNAIEETIRHYNIPAVIKLVGCIDACHLAPTVEIIQHYSPNSMPESIAESENEGGNSSLFTKVTPEQAEKIIRTHLKPQGIFPRMKEIYAEALDKFEEDEGPVTRYSSEVREGAICDFLGGQVHIATESCGSLQPLNLKEYRIRDGFQALEEVLKSSDPESVIETVTESGLRGRGGAGFKTGLKWRRVHDAHGDEKYVVMNGDEGDPSAFMDRMLLESYPFRILEGMIIGAYAVGSREGILYIRAEYPLATRIMREAIRICEENNLLGEKILNSDFSLSLKVIEGAGAFVCGEETALLSSIEGKRGEPRIRPPYPAESGLWGKPTLINNVETYAMVPWIIRHGAKAYAEIGTETSNGTKVFSLTGKIARGGLIEVPMGTSLRHIVEVIGGGTPNGKFKAVQIGGPSGGCIPADLADIPIDYEALQSVGAFVGSGGLVVLDEHDCMVDIARYFLNFTQNESCGKCTFCRVGTRRLLEMLDRISTGKGKPGDIDKLEELALQVKQSSLCGLGQSAPNPILSTLRYFRDEYEAHIQGRCPTGKCKDLVHYRIGDKCNGCTKCSQVCPVNAIPMRPYEKHSIDDSLCTRCDSCRQICPVEAIHVE